MTEDKKKVVSILQMISDLPVEAIDELHGDVAKFCEKYPETKEKKGDGFRLVLDALKVKEETIPSFAAKLVKLCAVAKKNCIVIVEGGEVGYHFRDGVPVMKALTDLIITCCQDDKEVSEAVVAAAKELDEIVGNKKRVAALVLGLRDAADRLGWGEVKIDKDGRVTYEKDQR